MKIRYILIAFALVCFSVFPNYVKAVTFDSGLFKNNAIFTDHFDIEFSNLIAGQTDTDGDGIADLIEVVIDAAENSYDVMIDTLNYDDPMAGYDRKLAIILDDSYEYVYSGAYGITSVLSNGDPYIAVDPWLAEGEMNVTIAHEYFHAVQFGYDDAFSYTYNGSNWAEATATWMEDQVYDDVNDYVNYLYDFFNYPDYSIFASIVPTDSLFQYGLNIWPRFLSEYYDDEDIIKDIWLNYFNSDVDYGSDLKVYSAVKEVVEGRGDDLDDIFQEFTLWNLGLSDYEEGDIYPWVMEITSDETNTDYTTIDNYYAPALYGTNYLYFENTGDGDDFYFNIVKPDGLAFAVSLVPYNYNNGVKLNEAVSTIIDEDNVMDEALILENIDGYDGVYAVVSALGKNFRSSLNVEAFDQGYLYSYLADYTDNGGEVAEAISEDGASDSSVSAASIKEGDVAGTDDNHISNTLTLTVVEYDEDSVSFSWNRLTDPDIASYEINYGVVSNHYDEVKIIEKAYTTVSSISGLEEGRTYYFELTALDSDGKIVGDASQEIAVTAMSWIFTDVSYMNEHFTAISGLTDAGVLSGYPDGSFNPDGDLNRAELLKILIEARGITPDPNQYKNCFKDVKEDWYAKYVCYAKERNWVNGYNNGTFKPAQAVNKVEALKILFNVAEEGLVEGTTVADVVYTDLDPSAWYAIYVWKASDLGILEEASGTAFSPTANRTRGEMSEEMYRYLVGMGEL